MLILLVKNNKEDLFYQLQGMCKFVCTVLTVIAKCYYWGIWEIFSGMLPSKTVQYISDKTKQTSHIEEFIPRLQYNTYAHYIFFINV